ncbi:MAG: tRNA pseudouridine(13) synthase TruD [Desulfobacteraceae bacterium]|jgi:tRNA pseudouridine13 synthase
MMKPEFAQHLKETMTRLPYIAGDLPGIGGTIKALPEHFQVEEILPYAPSGEGEHLFISLRRQGWNTADVGRALAAPFRLKGTDIGWGGRKDKTAVTTQTFSLRLPLEMPLKEVESALKELPFDILDMKRHGNKLKTGHVAANRFRIILSQVLPHAMSGAETIVRELRKTGLPNFYGEQRFGIALRNIDRSMGVLRRGKSRGKKEGFLVSALQSALFNLWLKERIERETFDTLILGDLVKKTDTGGMFVVEDLPEALQRFRERKIVYTGPIYGHKMRSAGHQAEKYEKELLNHLDLTPGVFKPLRAPGSRRIGTLYPDDLAIVKVPQGLEFTFTLPAGAYATTVLREFTRNEFGAPA